MAITRFNTADYMPILQTYYHYKIIQTFPVSLYTSSLEGGGKARTH